MAEQLHVVLRQRIDFDLTPELRSWLRKEWSNGMVECYELYQPGDGTGCHRRDIPVAAWDAVTSYTSIVVYDPIENSDFSEAWANRGPMAAVVARLLGNHFG